MKGRHHVRVENKRIRYEFDIKRNITVIKGDSATGKTNLVELIREYYDDRELSGVSVVCDCECSVLSGRGCRIFHTALRKSTGFGLPENTQA